MLKKVRLIDIVLMMVAALVILAVGYSTTVRPKLRTWGATDDEIARIYPADHLVPDGTMKTTHGIDIDAPPEEVWPWVSYFGLSRDDSSHSNVGISFFHTVDRERIFRRLLEVGHGDTLDFVDDDGDSILAVARQPWELTIRVAEPMDEEDRLVMTLSYYLEPRPGNTTRLVSRGVVDYEGDQDGLAWKGFVEPILFYADRNILKTTKAKAESGDRP